MAGSITISSITLDSDNNFSIKSNTGSTILSANGTGLITGIANGSTIISAQLTTPTITGDATINGMTVGKGGGSEAGSTTVGGSSLGGASTNTGIDNSAFGFGTLYVNTSGSSNSAFGRGAMRYNTTGGSNSAFGYQALNNNTTASDNTAVGYQAAYSNQTGTGITALGKGAAYAVTGNYNTILGWRSGEVITSGQANTIVGALAGCLSTGSKNTFIGGPVPGVSNGCASAMTTGSSNTIIGNYNGNQGNLDIRTSSNYIVLSDGDGNVKAYSNSTVWRFGSPINGTAPWDANTSGDGGFTWLAHPTYPFGVCNQNNIVGIFNRYQGSGTVIEIKNGATVCGTISHNGTNAAFNTSSDYRLKQNIAPMTNALETVTQLKPCTYKWKSNGSDGQGFIAHELQEVVPDCVTGEKDGVDADGNPVYQGIDVSFLVATLTAAIQELKALVDAQATEIAELKAKVA